MTVLFLIRNHGYIRNYESTLRMLAERGHRVCLVSRGAERHVAVDTDAFLEGLCAEHPAISVHRFPPRNDEWSPLLNAARALRNYVRYLHPRFRRAEKLRSRAANHALKQGVVRLPAGPLGRWLASRSATLLESAVPNDPVVEAAITGLAPDVVVVTPFVDFNSYQVDYVKAAHALGIPTVWCVASWDNLSNKGIAPVVPDRVLVWNNTQRREAIEMHQVPDDRVVVTGAQLFDVWFEQRTSTSHEEFCRSVGLPNAPFLLYLCSSLFIAPDEPIYVRRWLERLRASAFPELRECGVLIRPHPGNAGVWSTVDLAALGPVAIWPRAGEMPIEQDAKRHYFDSLSHCAAVVGVNTSGMIEAGIVGRSSFTFLAPDFLETQNGTVHFDYLTAHRFLTAAQSWDEHLGHLAGSVAGRTSFDEESRQVALTFVRPHGPAVRSTPRVVDAIEDAARISVPEPGKVRSRMWLMLARTCLARWVKSMPTPAPPRAGGSIPPAAPRRRRERPVVPRRD